MGIGLHLRAQGLVALQTAPHLGVGQEEALLRRVAVHVLARLASGGLLEGRVRHRQSAEVRDVLAQREATVEMQRIEHGVAAELIRDPPRALLVVCRVTGGPPVAQVALGIELAAAIVEAVRHLVPDHGADATVVHGIVPRRVIEGRLQDARREVDAVERGVVEGVHGRRRHEPLAAIHGLAELVDIAFHLDPRRTQPVGVERAPEFQTGVVAPLVRIADALFERLELNHGLLPGLRAHPVERRDPISERRLEVVHHVERALARRGREILDDVGLAEQVAEIGVRKAQAARCQRGSITLAPESRRSKEKASSARGLGQVRRGVVERVPAQVGLPVLDRRGDDQPIHGAEEIGLGDVDRIRLHSARLEVGVPVEAAA